MDIGEPRHSNHGRLTSIAILFGVGGTLLEHASRVIPSAPRAQQLACRPS
jgi:hypothetical protein